MFSFVQLDTNFIHWSKDNRLSFALITTVLIVFVFVFTTISDSNDNDNDTPSLTKIN